MLTDVERKSWYEVRESLSEKIHLLFSPGTNGEVSYNYAEAIGEGCDMNSFLKKVAATFFILETITENPELTLIFLLTSNSDRLRPLPAGLNIAAEMKTIISSMKEKTAKVSNFSKGLYESHEEFFNVLKDISADQPEVSKTAYIATILYLVKFLSGQEVNTFRSEPEVGFKIKTTDTGEA